MKVDKILKMIKHKKQGYKNQELQIRSIRVLKVSYFHGAEGFSGNRRERKKYYFNSS